MRFSKFAVLRSQAGLTLIEGLVAASIVATTAAGTAGLVNYIGKQSRRAQVLNRAIVLQSSLVNAMLSKSQWVATAPTTFPAARTAQIAALASGGTAPGLPILANPERPESSPVLAIVGQRVGYDVDGADSATCTGADCAIWVDVDVTCGGSASQGCRAAYRITVAPQPGEGAPPAPLGAMPGQHQPNPRAFESFINLADYSLPLSYDYFTQRHVSDCNADPENIFITGVNRTTGDLSCIARQAIACEAPQIAHGARAEMVDGKMRLRLQCHSLADVQCPPEYVLQQMDFSQLDPGRSTPLLADGTLPGLRGVCVYRWRNMIPWQGAEFRTASTSSTAAYAAGVCNTRVYDAVATGECRVVWDRNDAIACPSTCPSGACPSSVQATAYTTSEHPSGPDNLARCTVHVNQASCGGNTTTATAHGEWSGTCLVKERRVNPFLRTAPVHGVLEP